MADENKGVVPGTAGLRPGVLFTNTREIFQGAPAPPRKAQHSGVVCPRCKADNILGVEIMCVPGSGFQCSQGHTYKDQDEFLSVPHDTIPLAQPIAEQEGYVQVQFPVAGSVLRALQAKYPERERMNATFASLCAHMTEPQTLIIGEIDLRRISDKVGQPIRSGAELYGILEARQAEIQELKEQVAKAPAAAGGEGGVKLRRGELIIWLNPELTEKLRQKAEAAGKTPEEYLEAHDADALTNDWV